MPKKLNWLQRYVRRADPMEAFLATFCIAAVFFTAVIGVLAYLYTGGR